MDTQDGCEPGDDVVEVSGFEALCLMRFGCWKVRNYASARVGVGGFTKERIEEEENGASLENLKGTQTAHPCIRH